MRETGMHANVKCIGDRDGSERNSVYSKGVANEGEPNEKSICLDWTI